MANRSHDAVEKASKPRTSDVLSTPYRVLFMIIEPSIIWAGNAAIIANPANYFHSLAPADTISGPLFKASPDIPPCTQPQAWRTPELRSLLYLNMAALSFSAVIEPVLLYLARYKFRNVGDAERMIAGVLLSFAFFDVVHAMAVYLVVGSAAILPAANLDLSKLDFYACINVWVPMAWLVIRGLWFTGMGRATVSHEKME